MLFKKLVVEAKNLRILSVVLYPGKKPEIYRYRVIYYRYLTDSSRAEKAIKQKWSLVTRCTCGRGPFPLTWIGVHVSPLGGYLFSDIILQRQEQLSPTQKNLANNSFWNATKKHLFRIPVFNEPGSGSCQKSHSGSRRPLTPDPSYFLTISDNNIKLFHNSKIFSSKEVDLRNVVKSKIIL